MPLCTLLTKDEEVLPCGHVLPSYPQHWGSEIALSVQHPGSSCGKSGKMTLKGGGAGLAVTAVTNQGRLKQVQVFYI